MIIEALGATIDYRIVQLCIAVLVLHYYLYYILLYLSFWKI